VEHSIAEFSHGFTDEHHVGEEGGGASSHLVDFLVAALKIDQ